MMVESLFHLYFRSSHHLYYFLCRDCALPVHGFGAAFPSVNAVLIRLPVFRNDVNSNVIKTM